MRDIIVIAHNIRSTHNVGALLRTADGFGVVKIIFSGYTPYPSTSDDPRLPHIHEKLTRDIHKTALGAEKTVPFEYSPDITHTIRGLKANDYTVVGLEQDAHSVLLPNYSAPPKIALLLGEEVEGIPSSLRDACDSLVEIPMNGHKESFNVSVAAGIALYGLSYPSA